MIPSVLLSSGFTMPTIGIGVREVTPSEVSRVVQDAIDVGYRHLDCAPLYNNEREIGDAIRARIQDGSVLREELFVSTKLWNTRHQPDSVLPACKESLTNLGLDYLDLYVMHWPIAFKEGKENFPRDSDGKLIHDDVDYLLTYREMEQCVRLGYVRSLGLSNFNSEQVSRVLDVATVLPVTNQIECHPYLNQMVLAKICYKFDIVVTACSPLGAPSPVAGISGTPNLLNDNRLELLTSKYNKSAAQVVLRYMVQRGTVPLPKSEDKTHMIENMDIFDFELSESDMSYINVFDSRSRFFPFTESKDDPNYPFGVDF